jgi:hypothetical protein
MSAPERDWVRVVADERCDECGLEASSVSRDRLGIEIQRQADLWALILGNVDAGVLRERRPERRWSALEYAAHVRDVLALFGDRIDQARAGTNPDFGWWDHEAAAMADHYNEQHPHSVGAGIKTAADRLSETLVHLEDRSWGHTGTRRGTETFTVESLARFALHEAVHHRVDAELLLPPRNPTGGDR